MKKGKDLNADFLECLTGFIKTPCKLCEHFIDIESSDHTTLSDIEAAAKIKAAILGEIGDCQELTPTIHLFGLLSFIEDIEDERIKLLADLTENLCLFLYYLQDGAKVACVDGFFCSRNAAVAALALFEDDDQIKHRSWHIEYHSIPKNIVIECMAH
ncbi:hypothetical protein [Photobacterium leiognathi]|uniref:hypothetical protein n=1 Tax=Photobacterium leiognathi TaxID=553611 RepID=UPI002980ADCA|nr:hypothetical protein [Photobacterium leiognathi]